MSYQQRVAAEQFNTILSKHLNPERLNDPKIAEFIMQFTINKSVKGAAKESGLSFADGKYLYNQPDIYNAITEIMKSEVIKYGYSAAEVVERTKEIAFADPLDCMNPDGTYKKSLADIPIETRNAIKRLRFKNTYKEDSNGMMQYSGEIIDVEFWDKPKALELVAREKDTFKKTTVVEHDISKNARNYLLASARLGEKAVKELNAPAEPVKVVKPEVIEAEVIDVSDAAKAAFSLMSPPKVEIPLPPSIPLPPGMS